MRQFGKNAPILRHEVWKAVAQLVKITETHTCWPLLGPFRAVGGPFYAVLVRTIFHVTFIVCRQCRMKLCSVNVCVVVSSSLCSCRVACWKRLLGVVRARPALVFLAGESPGSTDQSDHQTKSSIVGIPARVWVNVGNSTLARIVWMANASSVRIVFLTCI